MKIEIGESIVYSWLRHIKKCQIVQSNWKTSPEWHQTTANDRLQAVMDKANIEFNNPFKKTQHLSQLFRQAEIDALGINIQENKLYAVDIAFHERGLSYGDKFETAKRITKKIIRTTLVLQHYFQEIPNQEVIFISPKINPGPLGVLEPEMERVSNFIKNQYIPCDIHLIANENFKEDILEPISLLSNNIADTSELFVRSIQLANLFAPSASTPQRRIITRSSQDPNKTNRRVPRWFRNPSQYNSTILIGYLELAETNRRVTVSMLRSNCNSISDFSGNYNQMKNFGEKNHGKVFEETNEVISLWEPVKNFILEQYNSYKNV